MDVEMADGSHAYSATSVDDVAGIEYVRPLSYILR